jgi:hypothetical protein
MMDPRAVGECEDGVGELPVSSRLLVPRSGNR